jgi:hypothetical protein
VNVEKSEEEDDDDVDNALAEAVNEAEEDTGSVIRMGL